MGSRGWGGLGLERRGIWGQWDRYLSCDFKTEETKDDGRGGCINEGDWKWEGVILFCFFGRYKWWRAGVGGSFSDGVWGWVGESRLVVIVPLCPPGVLRCCRGDGRTVCAHVYSSMASSWSARSSNMLPMSSRMLPVLFCSTTELHTKHRAQLGQHGTGLHSQVTLR